MGKRIKIAEMKNNYFIDPNKFITNTYNQIPSNIKITFLSAIIIGFITHIFMFTNIIPNHDTVSALVSDLNYLYLGRWFYFAAEKIDGIIIVPWIIGTLSILYLSLTAVFTVLALDIKKSLHCVLISCLLITFPSVACILSYMAHPMFLSLLLASIGVYVTKHYQRGFIIGGIVIAFSLGIYQAFFCYSAGLFIIILIAGILKGNLTAKEAFIRGVTYLLALIIGLILYFVILHISLSISGIVLSDYKGINNIGHYPLSRIPELTLLAYKEFFYYIFNYSIGFLWGHYFKIIRLIFTVSGISTLVMGAYVAYIKKIYHNRNLLALLILCIIIFPLAVNLIYIMSFEIRPYIIMLYALSLIPILMIAICEVYEETVEREKQQPHGVKYITCWIIILGSMYITYYQFLVTNVAYVKQQYTYEHTYAFSLKLAERIEALNGYYANIPVAFIGNQSLETNPITIPIFENIEGMVGILGENELNNCYSYIMYLRYYIGFPAQNVSPEKTEMLLKNQGVLKMPIYPAQNSIQIIDGVVVVKLGEI